MIRAKKHFGQHFLHDRAIIERIVAALDIQNEDRILEIGPGPGALTFRLADYDVPLTAIDADPDMITHLQTHHWHRRVHLICADALEFDYDSIIKASTKVISNLPYQTSVPITGRLLHYCERISRMVLMYQKEVAERIRAEPGQKAYGPISVLCQTQFHVDRVMNLGPGAFSPPPKVQSQVLRFERRERPFLDVRFLDQLRHLIEPLFQNRRKMVVTTLKKLTHKSGANSDLLESFAQTGLPSQARPEEISPEDYVRWLMTLKP
ncbi:MAG: ribosomal RNA small subunit methyltransferase A [Acidobacteria bacterium]|nr:ribosomal RNA small subunit methyltransferase A [Acidobacteriota bacterium]